MNSITLNAYAKINLYLDVTGKRPDGYHLLETVMHSISLCDKVTLCTCNEGISVSCSDASIPCDDSNIAVRCAKAFFEKTGISSSGVSIAIEKSIPTMAGLGGGSADGAAVLHGMNILFQGGLTKDELSDIAASIGADIPFCLTSGCGWCTGIGEIITPLPRIHGFAVIGKGSQGISTAEAFRKIDSCGISIGNKNAKQIFSNVSSLTDIAPYCRNVFDEASELDEVSCIKKLMLESGALCSCMTGSGSAVFGLFDDINTALDSAALLNENGFYNAVCKLGTL